MALVLTRRPGESVLIAREVCVTYLEQLTGGAVRLAFTAPAELQIDRLELALRVDPELSTLWLPDGCRVGSTSRWGRRTAAEWQQVHARSEYEGRWTDPEPPPPPDRPPDRPPGGSHGGLHGAARGPRLDLP